MSSSLRLRHLAAFVEVARLKSVSAAAVALSISQPAVSKTLREIEEVLGVKLIERSGRGVALTTFGEMFLGYASSSIAALNQGIDSIIRSSRGGAKLSVGALPTAAARLLPQAIQKFTADAPGVTVQVETGNNEFLLEQLRLGRLDVILGRLASPEHMTRLSFEHLYQETIVLAVRSSHPLLNMKRKAFGLGLLENYTVLMPPSGSIIRPDVERMFLLAGIPLPKSRIETVSMAFARPYLSATDAIWIISRGVVGNELDSAQLKELPYDTSKTTGPLGLTLRSDVPPSLPTQLFIETVRGVVKDWL
jgi:LysR family pca operon transcriptional activator